MRWCAVWLAIVWMVPVSPVAADDADARRPRLPQITSDELTTLGRQLNDARFAARARASRRLEEIGLPAFPTIAAAVRGEEREAQSRAMAILKTWCRAHPPELAEASVDLLQQISLAGSPLAREADDILAWRRKAIHQDAVKFLEGLEARVTVRESPQGYHTTIHISQTWRGRDEDLERLKDLEGLRWLSLEDSRVGNRGLAAVARCAELQYLMLGRCGITSSGLAPLNRLERLQHLSLQELPLTGEALASLGSMPQLTSLGLDKTRMTNEDLVHLQGFPNLKNLWLDYTDVTDEGLERVTHLSNLTHVYLMGTRTGGAGLRQLARLPRLTHLSLKEVQMTPEGMRELPHLSTLVSLGLDHTNVSDDLLAELVDMNHLQVLWLSKAPVTDASLIHLARMTGLRTVYAHGSKITKEGAETFMRERENRCRIHF